MSDDLLDNPAFAALQHAHAGLGRSSDLAAVYDPLISPLAGLAEPTIDALRDLAGLVSPGVGVGVLSTQLMLPESADWRLVRVMTLHQMVCDKPPEQPESFDELAPPDAREMVALAELTEPGPFLERTIEMGRYVGARIDGRLVAMAGERMKPPGWTEISGVCTHPEARGRGLARRLVLNVLAHCFDRGDRAFLHVVAGSPSEATAIGVYETLGFEQRVPIYAHVLLREGARD
ncbi:MAG: GNAT family N-acetyltransferase [Pseudomonadales bacterium]|nr:GNAT family N-acetyltransferase [Pseudomonadales bacterium]NIX07356.1 GNAT family N-acetyltransferase [Pseudomonadales bacterium]